MAAADFDLIQITEHDPYLETPQGADEPTSSVSQQDHSHTTAIMDTDKTPMSS
jgi:hypothetical protein